MPGERKKEGRRRGMTMIGKQFSVPTHDWVWRCNCACRMKPQICRKFAWPVDLS